MNGVTRPSQNGDRTRDVRGPVPVLRVPPTSRPGEIAMSDGDTHERLLEAAGEVFADKGYEAATVREILNRAGVRNLAAINYHFGDKERLYVEVVKNIARTQFQRNPLPAWPPETPPADKLRAFIASFVERVVMDQQPAWHGRLMMREVFQPTGACIEFVREYVRPTFDML